MADINPSGHRGPIHGPMPCGADFAGGHRAITAQAVAGFLMIMVGLGLMGVLWQNVTQLFAREYGSHACS